MSVHCNLVRNNQLSNIRIRGQLASRADTEIFIARLESEPFFERVISPLSNFRGKGKRFINIDLEIDTKKINKISLKNKKKEGKNISNPSVKPNLTLN